MAASGSTSGSGLASANTMAPAAMAAMSSPDKIPGADTPMNTSASRSAPARRNGLLRRELRRRWRGRKLLLWRVLGGQPPRQCRQQNQDHPSFHSKLHYSRLRGSPATLVCHHGEHGVHGEEIIIETP